MDGPFVALDFFLGDVGFDTFRLDNEVDENEEDRAEVEQTGEGQ